MIVHLNEQRGGRTSIWGTVPVETSLQVKRLSRPAAGRTVAEAVQEFERVLNSQMTEVADVLFYQVKGNEAWIELEDGRKLKLVPVTI